jgi:hypothetical protein
VPILHENVVQVVGGVAPELGRSPAARYASVGGRLERMQIVEKLRSWRARREFRRKATRLISGMSADEVRRLLGEPHRIYQYDDEEDFDSIWHYNHAISKDTDFCLAFKDNKYSHAWYAQYPTRKSQ